MAKISDIIFCIKATNIAGQGVSAEKILTAISPEYIPGLFSFSVIIILVDIEMSKEHSLTVDFLDPNNDNVVHIESLLPVVEDNSNLPSEYKGLNIAMDWTNVNLKTSGVYTIRVLVDGIFVNEKEIFVKGKNE